MANDLTRRFLAGSNVIHVSVPEQHRLLVSMPRDVGALRTLAGEIVATQHDQLRELEASHAEHANALRAVREHLNSINETLHEGFADVSRAIDVMTRRLSADLSEIKWVLGQIDERLAVMLELIRFPRETECNELIDDGVKALAQGNIDDAEYSLKQAVDLKRTSFQALMNLGFVHLQRGDSDAAVDSFRRARDYAPTGDKGAASGASEKFAE